MERKGIEQLIVKNEWEMFQNVKGIEGRAECQDQFQTFVIMRASQFESWPFKVIESYLNDLEEAKSAGRNLVMEKYAFMMEQTDPAYFESIKALLPPVSLEARIMAEKITNYYMAWEKEVEELYPNVRSHGRSASGISEDGTTSMENYLRCELMTYSEKTLQLLLHAIEVAPEHNLYMISLEKMAQAYGYDSLADAEKALA